MSLTKRHAVEFITAEFGVSALEAAKTWDEVQRVFITTPQAGQTGADVLAELREDIGSTLALRRQAARDKQRRDQRRAHASHNCTKGVEMSLVRRDGTTASYIARRWSLADLLGRTHLASEAGEYTLPEYTLGNVAGVGLLETLDPELPHDMRCGVQDILCLRLQAAAIS